jgi:hypothetical protein
MNHSTGYAQRETERGFHLLAVALGEVDDEAARRRQRHQRPRAGVPKLRVDRRCLLLPCTHTRPNQTNRIISDNHRRKRSYFSPLIPPKARRPPWLPLQLALALADTEKERKNYYYSSRTLVARQMELRGF